MYIGLAYLAEKLWFVNGREGDFMHGSVRQWNTSNLLSAAEKMAHAKGGNAVIRIFHIPYTVLTNKLQNDLTEMYCMRIK
jgi:hypothetical protein